MSESTATAAVEAPATIPTGEVEMCPKDLHPMDNVYVNAKGHRTCRECRKIAQREWRNARSGGGSTPRVRTPRAQRVNPLAQRVAELEQGIREAVAALDIAEGSTKSTMVVGIDAAVEILGYLDVPAAAPEVADGDLVDVQVTNSDAGIPATQGEELAA